MPPEGADAPALAVAGVSVLGSGPPNARRLLCDVDWRVEQGEHWAVLGANGAGKTTLLGVAAGTVEPAAGVVTVLGERHGAIGYRDPRLRIAHVQGRPRRFARGLTAMEITLLRPSGPVALRGERIRREDVEQARLLLARFGCEAIRDRRYDDCSEGERQRVLLARALMRRPAMLLLDEPAATLDLMGREELLEALARLAADRPDLTTITVTHRLEDMPASTTHALLLRAGALVAAGRVDEVLTDAALTACFGGPVVLTRTGGRWFARADTREGCLIA
jgi:iron complex transport system ATP-binding protein